MRGFPLREFATALLLFAGVLPCNSAGADNETAPEHRAATNVRAVRTIAPEDFHQSLKDRLTGGLNQQLPYRMTTDSHGRILVTEPFLSLVQVLDTKQGKRWQIRGDRSQRMVFPTCIAVDGDDNIYVADPVLAAVLVYRPDGHFLRAIGEDHLDAPFGLAVDKTNRKLYVADYWRGEIQVYTLEGQLQQTIAKRGTQPGELNGPRDIVLHHGMLFVLDSRNARFQFFDMQGNAKGTWPFGRDRLPAAFAFDTAGNLYYVDLLSRGMLVSDPADHPLAALDKKMQYGQPGRGPAFPSFMSVAEDLDGSVLALRPALRIEVVKLEMGAPPQANGNPVAQGLWEVEPGRAQ